MATRNPGGTKQSAKNSLQRAEQEPGTSKLTRCVCGQVFDVLVNANCPSCNSPAITPKEANGDHGIAAPSEHAGPSPTGWPPYWKIGVAAVLLLVGAYGLRLMLHSEEEESVAALSKESVVAPDAADSSQAFPIPPRPSEVPPVARGVEPGLVGVWRMRLGGDNWYLAIGKNGRYYFVNRQASGNNMAHSGDFGGEDGKWWLRSRTVPWDDGGTYTIIGQTTLTTVGRLGTGQWQRADARELHGLLPADVELAQNAHQGERRRGSRQGNFWQDNGILPPSEGTSRRVRR